MYCVCCFYLHTNSKYLGLVITVSFNKVITALSHTYGYDFLYKTSRQFSFFVTKLYIVLVYNSIISMLFVLYLLMYFWGSVRRMAVQACSPERRMWYRYVRSSSTQPNSSTLIDNTCGLYYKSFIIVNLRS